MSGQWGLDTWGVNIRETPTLSGDGGDNFGPGLRLQVVAAPEPATVWLLAIGGLALGRRRFFGRTAARRAAQPAA